MTQNRRVSPDSPNASPAMEAMAPGPPGARPASVDLADVAQIARTLEAHGGGTASADLALDLVLHDIVVQVRDATRAGGAAIALVRDEEMVCRATTGEIAPDLGVRVESSSGLAGLCVHAGTIQHCKDTESDSRVNPDVCRRLGVRSMLIAPLTDAGKVFGILQVFSALPHTFGDRDIDMLRQFATRIDQSRRELTEPAPVATPDQIVEIHDRGAQNATGTEDASASMDAGRSVADTAREIWSYILFVLVIAASIALGLVVGWRGGIKDRKPASAVQPTQVAAKAEQKGPLAEISDSPTAPKSIAPPKTPSRSTSVPDGGLVVTQNGRVIYRSAPFSANSSPKSSTDRSTPHLLRRIEPDYPEGARAQHIQGPVVLDVQVLANGEIGNVNVLSGDPLLAQAALKAVKQWRYEPADDNAKGIAAHTQVTIRFVLPPS